MPGGQFSHFRAKMSLARDMGHRWSIPGRSRPFRDGWQLDGSCLMSSRLTASSLNAFITAALIDLIYLGVLSTVFTPRQRPIGTRFCSASYSAYTLPY